MSSGARHLHIVVMRAGGIVVVRQGEGATFRELQERYSDYMTSLGPLDAGGVLDMFEAEWPDLLETNKYALVAFVHGEASAAGSELHITG